MRYYILTEAAGTKEVGPEYPQSTDMSNGYDYESYNSIYKLGEYRNRRVPFVPNLDSLKINDNSKVTDVVSCAMLGGYGLFISDRLRAVIEKFTLVDHIFYPASLIYKKQLYKNYYWFHLISDYRKFVDYKKSKFDIRQKGISPDKLKFTTYDDYLKFENDVDKFGLLQSEKIFLSLDFDYKLDLFLISQFDASLYISDKLKSTLINEGITGIEIEDANELICQ